MNKGIIIFVCLVVAYLFIKNKKKKAAEQTAENSGSGGSGGGNGNPPIPIYTPIYPQPAARNHVPRTRPPVHVISARR